MKRSGFTMIELIFVIVILGILAAVAIPKLAATRTDAQVSKMASNLSTIVSETGAKWTATGAWPASYSDLTNVLLHTTPGGNVPATTLNNDVTAADIAAATAQQAVVAAATGIADACHTANGPAPACAAEDQNVTDETAIYTPLLEAASIDPVYLNAGAGGEVDGCYSLQLSYLGDITISELTAATNPACVNAHTATSKNNLTAPEASGGKTHSFGSTGIVY